MQKIVDELNKILPLKETTDIGDIVIIAAKEPQFLVYARVNKIERDTSRRDEWWQVHMTMLSIPLQQITWTLRTDQMTGKEIFTMGGEERFVKAVIFNEQVISENIVPLKPKKKITTLKRIK